MDTIISSNTSILGLVYRVDWSQPDCLEGISLDRSKTDHDLFPAMPQVPLKPSQYNYTVKTNSGYILYNTLYNSLSRLNQKEYDKYCLPTLCDMKLKRQLIKQGFFLPQTIDEIDAYYRLAAFLRQNLNRPMKVILAPTMECNARCFYCYEAGVRHGSMTEKTAKKIVAWIASQSPRDGIEIVWFGGEPMIGKNSIDLISTLLSELGICFSSCMITNGSLLDNETLPEEIERWHLRTVQITIDGDEEEYLRRKNYVPACAELYHELMGHIRVLAQNGVNVQIRLNIDRDNVLSIYSAAAEIERVFGEYSNVSFYPAFLSGSNRPLDESEKIEIISGLLRRAKTLIGMSMKEKLYEIPHISACDINNPNVFAIDSKGDIYPCERSIGRKHLSIGSVFEGVINPERPSAGQRRECRTCVFLPKCFGGCQSAYNSGDTPCFENKYIIKAYLACL